MSAVDRGVRFIDLPCYRADAGELVVAEAAAQVPFRIARMFTLSAPSAAVRGKHAHRLCSQFMLCVHGAIDITCTNGYEQQTFTLNRCDRALLVPAGNWNVVTFRQPNSILVVLCDRPYEEHDYIRDYHEFLAFREAQRE